MCHVIRLELEYKIKVSVTKINFIIKNYIFIISCNKLILTKCIFEKNCDKHNCSVFNN